jgi:hypothetical protein
MGKEDGEEDISSYCVAQRKGEYSGIWKRMH